MPDGSGRGGIPGVPTGSTVEIVIQRRRVRATALVSVASLSLVAVACGGGADDDQQPGQIGRIDGPATVDEDKAGVDQEGAPPSVAGAIIDGS